MDWINPLYAWLGLGGVSIAAAVAVAIYFPPFRKIAVVVAVAIAGIMTAYAKGSRDASNREKKKRDKAVKKAEKDYAEIDNRPDTPSDAVKRMRDRSF